MKFLMIFGLVVIIAVGCGKTAVVDNYAEAKQAIVGTWHVMYDSSSRGVGLSSEVIAYRGTPADYYQFSANGNVHVREGLVDETVEYTLLPDSAAGNNTFRITIGMDYHLCTFGGSVAHILVIGTGFSDSPGGVIGKRLVLYR
ncbi:hypothetical protein [Puia dinghuensis]|uniref:Uncharacterized protein n=1 Tax=Puia dinghuensis TaxID=1792502 RepID=A0A8J2UHM7_9BACT|nr:hypothetical protein [Puia dinghuensis]GGB18399.1 hypothetical protein GCM10011511_47780 [Puia dinghuensis]